MSEHSIPEPTFDPDEMRRLLEQLDAENETISFLLKTHLFSEYHLDRLLSAHLGAKREPLDRIDLRFAQKVSLVDSFALLPEDCIRCLRALNKLRNRCVHNFDTRPSLADVRQVAREIPSFLETAQGIDNVPQFLKAFMMFLFGYFSAAGVHLEQLPGTDTTNGREKSDTTAC